MLSKWAMDPTVNTHAPKYRVTFISAEPKREMGLAEVNWDPLVTLGIQSQ